MTIKFYATDEALREELLRRDIESCEVGDMFFVSILSRLNALLVECDGRGLRISELERQLAERGDAVAIKCQSWTPLVRSFQEACDLWTSNDEWQYADREAAWKWFFECKMGSQQVPEGWQPIETAPKDGTVILAKLPDSTVPHSVRFDPNFEQWCVVWDGCILAGINTPESWIPLPAATQSGVQS